MFKILNKNKVYKISILSELIPLNISFLDPIIYINKKDYPIKK